MSHVLDFLMGVFCLVMGALISLADRFERKKKSVPAPEASAGPSAPEALDNHGCYVEPRRTYELRAAFVARRATPAEIQASKDARAIRELMQNVGRN